MCGGWAVGWAGLQGGGGAFQGNDHQALALVAAGYRIGESENLFSLRGSGSGFANWETGGHFYRGKINEE